MDFDGFHLLMKHDFEKFATWDKTSKNLSLDELRKNYNEWHEKMIDAVDKYGVHMSDADKNDISLFMAQTTYFLYLTVFCLNSLRSYSDKLREEHEELKKSKKPRTKTASKSSKPSKKRSKSL